MAGKLDYVNYVLVTNILFNTSLSYMFVDVHETFTLFCNACKNVMELGLFHNCVLHVWFRYETPLIPLHRTQRLYTTGWYPFIKSNWLQGDVTDCYFSFFSISWNNTKRWFCLNLNFFVFMPRKLLFGVFEVLLDSKSWEVSLLIVTVTWAYLCFKKSLGTAIWLCSEYSSIYGASELRSLNTTT